MEGGAEAAGSRLNRRPSSNLHVDQQGRKPLFASANSSKDESDAHDHGDNRSLTKPEIPRYRSSAVGDALPSTRRNNSEFAVAPPHDNSASTVASSGNSRIPKPTSTFSPRRPMSLAEAFKMAEDEEARGVDDDGTQSVEASPSPAPRTWRARREAEQNNLRKELSEDPLDVKSREKARREETSSERANNAGQDPTANGGELGGSFKSTDDAKPWANRYDWRRRPQTGPEWFKELGSQEGPHVGSRLPDLVPGIEDMPIPSIEGEGQERHWEAVPSWRRKPTPTKITSPEKSFAWQVDEDFTAGDLQVSDSPRIKVDNRPFANRLLFDENSDIDIHSRTRVNNPGSQNTKLDEIRSREIKAGNNIPIDRPRSRSRNAKLDEIRARESEAEKDIPIPDRRLRTFSNTKLDDIRQREADGLTKRQLAAARLEEIREQNAMARSKSPEEAQQPATNPQPTEATSKSQWETGGERIPDTPVTVFKGRRDVKVGADTSSGAANDKQKENGMSKAGPSHRRADSRDVLRQLARTASSSPAGDTAAKPAPSIASPKADRKSSDRPAPTPRGSRRALTASNVASTRRANNKDGRATRNGSTKPTVGFAGLRRVKSSESSGSKRSSVHSEMDPTERIDAEMKLFAPMDNHSERGSVRAPSPAPDSKKEDEDEVEATPRASKPDPQLMPTPKVTGAYVETPATVKVERFGDEEISIGLDIAKPAVGVPLTRRDRNRASRGRSRDTASEPGEDEKPSAITTSLAPKQPRARSLPRRPLPLKNSAKLPSVKDDLQELQRTYDIDDSTLDDLEEILSGRKAPNFKMKALLNNLPTQPADDDSFDTKLELMSQHDLDDASSAQTKLSKMKQETRVLQDPSVGDIATLGRIDKRLSRGLFSIHSAMKGIDRMHDGLTDGHEPRPKEGVIETELEKSTRPLKAESKHPPRPVAESANTAVTYLYVPMPQLYQRQPRFRLTVLGFVTMLASLWYALESGTCALFCQPTSCTTTPCVWSYDDPTFGKALPVKLDQWATGGVGRTLVNHAFEEAEDWVADMLDSAYGRNIMDVDVESLSFEGKRAHRRRLRKKGLDERARKAEAEAPPEVLARWNAWHRERLARDHARDARSMGYESLLREDESIGSDQWIG